MPFFYSLESVKEMLVNATTTYLNYQLYFIDHPLYNKNKF